MGRYLDMLLARDADCKSPRQGTYKTHKTGTLPRQGRFCSFEGTPALFKNRSAPVVELPPRSVSLADLSRLQKRLLPHLAECRDCVIEPHRYCSTAEADGWAYQCLLTDCEDADQLHAAFVGEVIRARICGLKGHRDAMLPSMAGVAVTSSVTDTVSHAHFNSAPKSAPKIERCHCSLSRTAQRTSQRRNRGMAVRSDALRSELRSETKGF